MLHPDVRRTRGFTLIELLVVVVVIGVLAAIAIPRFASSKERAYVVAMRNDLRNLLTAQTAYHSDQEPPEYAATLAALGTSFRTSTGVSVALADAGPNSWSAVATHNATTRRCAVYVGVAPVAPATAGGEVGCD